MPSYKTQEPQPRPRPSATPALLAPLPPQWAFVVQLRRGTPLTADALQGRVEHIVSGQATTFSSLEEARAFMDRVLTQLGEKPP